MSVFGASGLQQARRILAGLCRWLPVPAGPPTARSGLPLLMLQLLLCSSLFGTDRDAFEQHQR